MWPTARRAKLFARLVQDLETIRHSKGDLLSAEGEPMDAEAVKASLERHMTMQGSFRKPELAAVDKIEVVDVSTVRLLLKDPDFNTARLMAKVVNEKYPGYAQAIDAEPVSQHISGRDIEP